MTDKQIKEQIEVIKRASKNAGRTKETALQFLIDAGIIKANSPQLKPPNSGELKIIL